MRPSPFSYARPATLAEALQETARGAVPLAGGQSLIAAMRQRETSPAALVDLQHVDELAAALHWREHSLAIGARVTHATLLRDERVAATFPWLTQAVRALGDVQVRQRGTTVGNVCWADPRANMLVALSASDAVVVLQAPGQSGLQRMPIADFITGFRQTAAGTGIVLTIEVPRAAAVGAYLEFSRQRQDLALVNVCVVRQVGSARIVVGGLGERPVRLSHAEALLGARPLSAGLSASELDGLFDGLTLDPPPDIYAPPRYRLQLARELLARTLKTQTEAAPHG